MKKQRLKIKRSAKELLMALKANAPKIVFKTSNLIVTLRDKDQLKGWLKKYPEGTYTINNF
tara:strand:+ start:225 stop:407 length:183 start_codon:yes stop_codon:yes gene_type:complete